MKRLSDLELQIKEAAEADLIQFTRLIAPEAVLGHVHEECLQWLQSPENSSHRMVLLPRDHQKSRMAAFYALWQLAKNPCIRILYISSTANLAEKQLKFIKDKLESKKFRKYWPEHLHPEEGKRERWTNNEIELDHPSRKEQGIRDPSVFTAGLTTSITGMHCDLAILDDVVVHENATTEDGRQKVASQVSLLTSIEGAESEQIVVGTRYHPEDIYGLMQGMEYEDVDEEGDVLDTVKVYSVFQRAVEDDGEYLWPRQQRASDGAWFGFNAKILNRKKAQYLDKTQFFAQYYNNPNNPEGSGISDGFQYYDRDRLSYDKGYWFFNRKRLNVFAAIDFAFTVGKRSDYTTIAVVGVDCDKQYYVLDLYRFKTDKISVYYDNILKAHEKWGFRKLRCEVTAAQVVITRDLRDNYIVPNGLGISIDEYRPGRAEGRKEERVTAILEPRYANQQIWHYKGGNCQILEEELVLERPAHDDVKDAVASAIDVALAPVAQRKRGNNVIDLNVYHSRFGGVA